MKWKIILLSTSLLLVAIFIYPQFSAASFSGIYDMHEHFWAGGNMKLYLKIARKLGITKTLFVPTGKGPDNAEYKENMAALLKEQKKRPNRIVAFCTVDEADPQAPKIFKKCLDQGGRGLKLMSGHPNFYDVPIDSPVMFELFKIAADRNVPVMMHVSITRIPQAKEELKRLLDAFPAVRFIFAHYCSTIYNGIHLEQCAEFLDRYPNLMTDLAMGGGIKRYFKYMTESEENARKIKEFILKYQDRILYGTDIILAANGPTQSGRWLKGRIKCDFDLHRKARYRCPTMNKKDENIDLPGFELPEEVLKKLYIENPKKFLGI